ncbi:MAG: hypothetical protein PVH87_07680 [Desulfobacteraceae bacterium]|jgi:CheY-like chemotaxis protein
MTLDELQRAQLLLIEDDPEWQAILLSTVTRYGPIDITTLTEYEEADQFIASRELKEFDAAIVDVRLRKQIYDQGGLAILDLLKERRPDIPVLVLTAYSRDYPGLRGVTERYRNVYTYDKNVFVEGSDEILHVLLSSLPPQIGDEALPPRHTALSGPKAQKSDKSSRNTPLREIGVGIVAVLFILTSSIATLVLLEKFSDYPRQSNVVFSVVVLALLCVILRVFKPAIVREAISAYRELTGQGTKAEPNKAIDSDKK